MQREQSRAGQTPPPPPPLENLIINQPDRTGLKNKGREREREREREKERERGVKETLRG